MKAYSWFPYVDNHNSNVPEIINLKYIFNLYMLVDLLLFITLINLDSLTCIQIHYYSITFPIHKLNDTKSYFPNNFLKLQDMSFINDIFLITLSSTAQKLIGLTKINHL